VRSCAWAPRVHPKMINLVGIYLLGRAEFGRAKSVWERALKIFQDKLGDVERRNGGLNQ